MRDFQSVTNCFRRVNSAHPTAGTAVPILAVGPMPTQAFRLIRGRPAC